MTEQPGPVQTSATGGVEAGDKSKPFVQNAVITSEEGTDGSSAAQARPATASPVVDSATADDGGLVRAVAITRDVLFCQLSPLAPLSFS